MSEEREDKPGWGYEELLLRRLTARSEGLMANSPEKLFPGQNLHFKEIEIKGGPRIALGYLKSEIESSGAVQKEELTPRAWAYFCTHCGSWIQSPHSEKTVDPETGSTVYNLSCTTCEYSIGQVTGIKS